MEYNNYIIEKLRHCFDPDEYDQYTNCALVFAYNGTGKTRLSYDFAHYGREEGTPQHTLYYNAYTEDLFTWDNDLKNNTDHHLLINQDSLLIQGLAGYSFTEKLRQYLHVFTDIDFDFHYDKDHEEIPDYVTFSKTVKTQEKPDGELIENIKISRGEERLFVWCFFRCILDQVTGGNDAYKDIEYIYIDDPMSSLDDNNVITFAEQLYKVIRQQFKQEQDEMKAGRENIRRIKFVVSSHHALFFHVMLRGLSADKSSYYLYRDKESEEPVLKQMNSNTPFYYNVAIMSELQRAIKNGKLYTFHFNMLRSVMEKIQEFFGHRNFGIILHGITFKDETFDRDAFERGELTDLFSRFVNVFSHQAPIFSPMEMNDDNKEMLKIVFYHIKKKYQFQLPDLTDERSEREIYEERRNAAQVG